MSSLLERRGHRVLTTHLLADDADAAENALTERDVFERDLQWLESAGLLIAEASGSSYGVGFEVGYVLGRAAGTGQRVLLLYNGSRRSVISRLIPGASHPACVVREYRDPEDIVRVVGEYLDGFRT